MKSEKNANRSLDKEFQFFLLGISALFLLLLLMAFLSFSRLRSFTRGQEKLVALNQEILHTQGSFEQLVTQTYRGEYLSEEQNPDLLAHLEHFNRLKHQADSLINNENFSEEIEILLSDSLMKNIQFHQQSLQELKKLTALRGDQQVGLVSQLLKQAQLLSENLQSAGDAALLAQAVELNREIQAYIAQHRETDQIRARNLLKSIQSAASDPFFAPADSLAPDTAFAIAPVFDFLPYAEACDTLLRSLARLDQKIGFAGKQGVLQAIDSNFDALQNHGKAAKATFLNTSRTRRYLFPGLAFLLMILLGSSILVFVRRMNLSLKTAIGEMKARLQSLSKGNLPEKLEQHRIREYQEMGDALNELTENLENTRHFALEVGKGNIQTEINVFGNSGELGGALVQMRDELSKVAAEREKQLEEDKKRNWTTQGVAKFGEILRQSTDDTEELAFEIILNLVKYLNANQGGLFLYNDENKKDIHLELVAAYAYDRRKFFNKKIELGEGLVGTCAIEKQTIYMTKIPSEYIEITSGLGKATPRSLLIVPLRLEEKIFGIVEIASFNQLEKHQIEFVEKIAESIASTLSSVKVNRQTTKLLEESRQQAEAMAAQEEEMRQNLEELQTTQEEAAKREAEMRGIYEGLNASFLVAELDTEGKIINVNQLLAGALGETSENLEQKDFFEIDNVEGSQKLVEQLRAGQDVKRTQYVENTETWLSENYTPIFDNNGNFNKILYIATDISEMKKQEQKMHEQAQEMQKRQQESERLNQKLKNNETIMRKALERSKKSETQLKQQAEEMAAQEEEMRQNMEELQTTQEEMAKKQADLEKSNKKMKENENIMRKAVEKNQKNQAEMRKKEQEVKKMLAELQESQKAVTEKEKQLNRNSQKMKQNQEVLKKIVQKNQQKEDQHKKRIAELEAEIKKLKSEK